MEHIGEKFNKLTIIDLYRKDKRSRKYYLCKCDCGNTKVVRYDCLTSNNTQSCGCALKESAKRNGNKNFKDLTGKRFGRLEVLELTDKTDNNYGKYYLCKCDCGNTKIIRGTQLTIGKTKSCGCLNLELASKRMKGENNWNHKHKGKNHPNYNPELTDKERLDKRDVIENINWRKSVYERDNYTCLKCKAKGNEVKLNAHHINNYSSDEGNRFNIDNGITLCINCHKKFHHDYGIRNNSYEQIESFLKDNTEANI